MKRILKYLGIPIVLVGVVVLAVPFFMGIETNRSLVIGLSLIIGGFLYYIFSEKYL